MKDRSNNDQSHSKRFPHLINRIFVPITISTALFFSAASAQDTAGIDSLMALCIPISATGESVRAALPEAGWRVLGKPRAAEPVANLIASQMWHLAADSSPQKRLDLTGDYTNGVYASLGTAFLGLVFTRGDDVAMVLADGDSLSCIWAGPKSDALLARIEAIGGLPEAEGTVIGAKTQTVEAGGTDYSRIETYAFIARTDRAGPLPYAARLDRFPTQ